MALDLKELTHKVGPLPVWAWGALAVGGIVIFERLHGSSSSSSSGTQSQTDPATGLTYAQEAQLEAQGIDPLTGQPISSEGYGAGGGYGGGFGGGGGWSPSAGSSGTSGASGTATAPASGTDLAGEVADITSLSTALAGLRQALDAGPASQTTAPQAGPAGPQGPPGPPAPSPQPQPAAPSVVQTTGAAASSPTPHLPATVPADIWQVTAQNVGSGAASVGAQVAKQIAAKPPPAPVSRNKPPVVTPRTPNPPGHAEHGGTF